jgi:endoribonuclease Dicer
MPVCLHLEYTDVFFLILPIVIFVLQNLLFNAREYQRNIIDVCKRKNSIIYLPTGAGKTYIAIQIIKHYSDQLKESYTEGGKRSVFLVNSVFLAKQQKRAIEFHLPYRVASVTGDDNVDAFVRSDWHEILDKNEILVMTAQCFLDAVCRTFIKLQQINVIVFDECHHARKKHAYRQIMQLGENFSHIKILGLSGTLTGVDNLKPHAVSGEMRNLEAILQSSIITVNNIDDRKNVLLYSTKARKFILPYDKSIMPEALTCVVEMINKLTEQLPAFKIDNFTHLNPKNLKETMPKRIKDLVNTFKDFVCQAGEMGNFGG